MKLTYKNAKDCKEAFAKVKNFVTPTMFSKYNISPKIDYLDDQKKIVASGKGFDFYIKFHDTELEMDLDMGLLLKPFKAKILEKIESELKNIV